jgi:putative transcriptional regulator
LRDDRYSYHSVPVGGGGRDVNQVNRVKLARVENDLTQAQLAEKIGVTRQTIGLIERGSYNPTLKLCLAIARATNKTLDALFWDEEGNND